MVERILVVDDEEYLRALISQVLRNEGHDVATAESGEAALEAFQQERFPIVVTDIFMGGMSGLDLLQEVKSRAPDTQKRPCGSRAALCREFPDVSACHAYLEERGALPLPPGET